MSRANYSFDFGNVHCIVLDANLYMDWTNAALCEWLEDDLRSAHKAKWKIVVWHQPPFNSDAKYRLDERMCVVSPLLEKYGVDLVFNGHCHLYERSFPMRVRLEGEPKEALNDDGTVDGTICLDKKFDGLNNREPKGIIYVVTGAGGRPADDDHKPVIQPFTARLIAERNSFTMCDVAGDKLTMRQISTKGEVLDQIVIEKSASQPLKLLEGGCCLSTCQSPAA
jgi:hypothetical protein